SNPYTVAGANALTFDVGSGVAGINVTNGNHVLSAPITLNDDLRITTESGAGVTLRGALTAAGRAIITAGLGTTQLGSFQANALNVVGGTLNLAATPPSSLNVQVGTVTVGQVTNIGNDINASVHFDSGSVTLTNLQLASLIQATLTNNTVAGSSNGTFTVGGASPNTTSTAVLTVSGQTSLAKRTITTSGGSASGSLVINGGTANLL